MRKITFWYESGERVISSGLWYERDDAETALKRIMKEMNESDFIYLRESDERLTAIRCDKVIQVEVEDL